jgi:hypothetical protein
VTDEERGSLTIPPYGDPSAELLQGDAAAYNWLRKQGVCLQRAGKEE